MDANLTPRDHLINSAAAVAVVAALLFGGRWLLPEVAAAPPAPVRFQLGGAAVDVTPLRTDGLDVVFRADVQAHPGALLFQVSQGGTLSDLPLGEVSWKADAGAPASAILTAHLTRQASSLQGLRFRVYVEGDAPGTLLPGPGGTLGLTRGGDCGASAGDLPSGQAIRARIAALDPSVPAGLAAPWSVLRQLPDSDLQAELGRALAAVRCASPAPAPPHPAAVPAAQVKAWAAGVVCGDGQPWAALRPVVAAVPDESLRWLYLRAVELRRGLPAGSLG